jgi:hypothetical protein
MRLKVPRSFFFCAINSGNDERRIHANHPEQTQTITIMKQTVCAIVAAIACVSVAQAQATTRVESNIKLGGREMPNSLRNSMTATIGTQTIRVAIIDSGCVISLPSRNAYLFSAATNSIVEISQAEFTRRANRPRQTQGASFGDRVNVGLNQAGRVNAPVNQAGSGIVSAALSSVSSTTNGGAGSAAYAATGRTASWDLLSNEPELRLPDSLPDGDYEFTLVLSRQIAEDAREPLKTQVRIGLTSVRNVLRTKHDTVKNSISNVR